MRLESLNTLIEISKQKPKKKIAVAAADDLHVLEAISASKSEGFVDPILIGNSVKIKEIAEQIGFNLNGIKIIEENNPKVASRIAVQLVREDKAQILMKGMVGTANYLRAVLDKENGLRKGTLLSHVGFFEIEAYHKLIALTDAAQNIEPTLMEKVGIINNTVDMFHHLGIENPKVAVLAAVEGVNPKMPATIDAAALSMMNRRKQIKNCIIDGPLAFDNAISIEATHHKGIESEVAGDADLILAPNIEVANALYKSFTYFGKATVASVILGATVPIVLTSRADTDRSKLMSIALAASY